MVSASDKETKLKLFWLKHHSPILGKNTFKASQHPPQGEKFLLHLFVGGVG